MFQLKIKGDVSAKAILMLRKFDSALSMGEIKQRIQKNAVLIEQEEFADDFDQTTMQDFAVLVSQLTKEGADVVVLEDDEPLTKQMFQNRLEALGEISEQVKTDIQRENGF